MTTNNIVTFPKNKIVREAINDVEIIKKATEQSQKNYADTVLEELIGQIVNGVDDYGLDKQNEKFVRDFNFALGILSAAVYRSLKIPHDLHDFLDTCVQPLNPDENNDA